MVRRMLAAAAGVAMSWAALAAESFPAKPIRVVVPYAAGGADTYVRPLVPALQAKHNMSVVIDIVVGAGGLVGAAQVKRAPPDGYTLLYAGSGAMTIAPKLQPGAGVGPQDFAPVISTVSIPYIVAVAADSPVLRAGGFIEWVRRNPDRLRYGTPGTGSAPHLGMEALAKSLDAKLVHVPFTGIAPAVQALLGGHLEAVIGAPSVVLPQVRGGKLAAIGVTSKERFQHAKEIPAFNELGGAVDVSSYFGFFAPAGTPPAIIERLGAAIRDAAGDPLFAQAMARLYNNVTILAPGPFTAALDAEAAAFAPVIASLPKN